MAHAGGRPRLVTREIVEQIVILRTYSDRGWAEIGDTLGLPQETCRRAYWEHRRARGTVGNSQATIRRAGTEA